MNLIQNDNPTSRGYVCIQREFCEGIPKAVQGQNSDIRVEVSAFLQYKEKFSLVCPSK